jgi:hypothetical protein
MTDEQTTNAGAGPVERMVRPGAEAPTLVERLRTRNGRADGFGLGPVCDEAADKIERLHAVLAECQAHLACNAVTADLVALYGRVRAALGPNVL